MWKVNFRVSRKSNVNVAASSPLFLFMVFGELILLCSCEYGAACDQNLPCDTSQHLACIGNHCQCESPSNQRFDNSSQKCLSVVGGPCSPSGLSPNVTLELSQQRKDCITNARCVDVTDENGVLFSECQCQEDFIENSMGHCVPGIGSACSYLPGECNPLGMVVCKNGRCQCLDELQVYDFDMKRCVSPAGTHCKYDSLQLGCVKNAICYPFFYWIPPKCLCKPGYIQTKSRQCVPELEYNKNASNAGIVNNSPNDESNWPGSHAHHLWRMGVYKYFFQITTKIVKIKLKNVCPTIIYIHK